ncbi:plasmid mobilization protein [Streptomyces sp. NPDC060205]|uniref:plasmid mobilization protein n=1 Tax=Streptomyces sp. NPDC060205 TaxID=3347072 RepID=UPI003656A3E0
MAKKQINVRVEEAVYAGIEERAAAVGMEVNEYARQLLADEANDLRHRFLTAADHFAGEWAEHFDARFGADDQGAAPSARKDGRAA